MYGAIARLCGSMGALGVAKAIDSEEIINWMNGLGYDEGKGFHVGAPGPAADIVALLRTGNYPLRPRYSSSSFGRPARPLFPYITEHHARRVSTEVERDRRGLWPVFWPGVLRRPSRRDLGGAGGALRCGRARKWGMDPGDIEVMVEIVLDEARDELSKGKSAPKRFVLIEGEEIVPFGRDLDDYSPDLDNLREIGRLVSKVEKDRPDAVVLLHKGWAQLGDGDGPARLVRGARILGNPGRPRPGVAVVECLVAHVLSRAGVAMWLQPYVGGKSPEAFARSKLEGRTLDPAFQKVARLMSGVGQL
jgi:hypothetical protein